MRVFLRLALLSLLPTVGACAYVPTPPDPIRYVRSPAVVATCRRLGRVGLARTDGVQPHTMYQLSPDPLYGLGDIPTHRQIVLSRREITGIDFAERLDVLRDRALGLGATDLLLSRRIYRDWSYVEGIAYACRR